MTITELGAIGELVGGVAVIASLIYVGLQVRENSSWLKRQALDGVIDRFTTWGARVRDNPEILDVYLRGVEGFESLNVAEQHRFHLTKMEILAAIETVLEHGKSNMIKPETTAAARRWLEQEMSGPGTKAWWDQMGRTVFSDDLGGAVDQLIREGPI